jgi:hypothetical protein
LARSTAAVLYCRFACEGQCTINEWLGVECDSIGRMATPSVARFKESTRFEPGNRSHRLSSSRVGVSIEAIGGSATSTFDEMRKVSAGVRRGSGSTQPELGMYAPGRMKKKADQVLDVDTAWKSILADCDKLETLLEDVYAANLATLATRLQIATLRYASRQRGRRWRRPGRRL